MGEALSIHQVSKRFITASHQKTVLQNIEFDVKPGEFVSIIGPSGCGKSTLLRLIVGLDQAFDGTITLGNRTIEGPGSERGIVFQDNRLLPWLTLEQNVGLALENVAWSKQRKQTAISDHLRLVGLEGNEQAYPYQLSGGMAQRAAIARGLVARPDILLLDEPLGALDALTRIHLQDELLKIWHAENVSMILVTHDIEEAIYLSNRIVVLEANPGTVRDIIDVDLASPRDRASHEFADLRREIFACMSSSLSVH